MAAWLIGLNSPRRQLLSDTFFCIRLRVESARTKSRSEIKRGACVGEKLQVFSIRYLIEIVLIISLFCFEPNCGELEMSQLGEDGRVIGGLLEAGAAGIWLL